jgi:hypothetical protein
VLIVFDRMFGTYCAEDVQPRRYGIPGLAPSDNPLRIALGEWLAMARDFRAAPTWRGRLRALVTAP